VEGEIPPRQLKEGLEGNMRKREDVLRDGTRVEILILEVLLDLRDLLKKQEKKQKTKGV